MKSREDIVSKPNDVSLLDLPKEIWDAIPSAVLEKLGNKEVTKIKWALSMSCTTLYSFFQADLDKGGAERLLSYVLQGNALEAKKMYVANPRLLFIEATAKEYAAGLDENGNAVHRCVTESPFKAAARAGDVWMLKDMKEQFGKVIDKENQKNGETLAKKQLAEVFPNDFEYPASRYDFNKLVEAITTDQILINATNFVGPGEASVETEKALAQFRKDFMPGSDKMGFHFNLNELIKASEIYNSNFNQWNPYQQGIFWSQVVGYLERLVSACDAQVQCQGTRNVLDGKPLERHFELDLYLNDQTKIITYFPLSDDPSCYLGGTFAVDSYWLPRGGGGPRGGLAAWRENWLKQLCRLKTAGLEEFRQQLHKSVDLPEVSQDVQQACRIL